MPVIALTQGMGSLAQDIAEQLAAQLNLRTLQHELAERVARISPLIDSTALAQERALSELAIAELQAQQKRLGSYSTQAQFALASLYDGATAGGGR